MKLLIAGDFCPQYRVALKFDKREFESVLGEIKNVISQADYSIVNLECPVTKGGEIPMVKQGPNLKCSEKGIEAIRWAGFDCVTLANNHFLDYGEEGAKNTLMTCRKNLLDCVGGGMSLKEASSILYKEIKGQKIAIINCCEHEFSIATENTAGSNPLNLIQQYYAINTAKKIANRVIVIVHGGHEHYQLPSPRMQESYRYFIDVGADAVVNHHQHCYSGYEIYNNKPIIYGLGNFCFDKKEKKSPHWYEGYMVMLDFSSQELVNLKILPYSQCGLNPKVEMLPESAFDKNIEKLNVTINDSKALHLAIDKYYSACAIEIENPLEPLFSKYFFSLKRRKWLPSFICLKRTLMAENNICCESHRDKLIWCLKHRRNDNK